MDIGNAFIGIFFWRSAKVARDNKQN